MSKDRYTFKEISNKKVWDEYFSNALKSNLSQDWGYGEFREKTGNWKVKRYSIVAKDQVVGIFQCYEKSMPVIDIFKIVYINRGPLLLSEFNNEQYSNLIKALRQYFSIFRGKALILSPFREISAELEFVMKKQRFISKFTNSYTTSYLDLTKSEELLRKELNAKWRNQLNTAEKKELRFVTDETGAYDEFVLKAYRQMSSEKEFDTLSNQQLSTLFGIYRKQGGMYVYLVLNSENEPLAFKIFIGYGKSVVYFIGWVSTEGRPTNAPKFLIWNAVKELKSIGYIDFDLGGLDPVNLPGISKFKQGMGGRDAVFTERWISII